MMSHENTHRTLMVAGLVLALLGGAAPAIGAGTHYTLYQEGKRYIAQKDYSRARHRLHSAYRWAKRELGDRINPDYVICYCEVLVFYKDWHNAEGICAEAVRLARGGLAARAARWNRAAVAGKSVDDAAGRAKWGLRYLENGQYSQAIDSYRRAIKLHPAAEHYLGLCRALAGDKQLGPATAACRKALALGGSAEVAAETRKMLVTLKGARASAHTPAQARAVTAILNATVKLQMLSASDLQSRHAVARYLPAIRACVAATGEAIAAGLSPSTRVEVERFAGLKTTAVRNVQEGRYLGWKHYATIAAVARLCRSVEGDSKLEPYRKVLRGDRYKTFRDHGLADVRVYTRNRRRLFGPSELQRASVWFQELTYTNGCPARVCWRLRRIEFRGDRLRGVTEKTGKGDTVPMRYYR